MTDSKSDDLLVFSDEEQHKPAGLQKDRWKIVIADDDEEVHSVTKLVLKDFTFSGKGIQLISAYSAEEANHVLQANPDAALLLLDIVMESEHAGLDVVKYVREVLKNSFVRIVLRTGQPGQAPEEEIIRKYDINDYKDKTELTSKKLLTLMYGSLRSYQDIRYIDNNKKLLEKYYMETVDKLKEGKKHIFNVIDSMPSILIGIDKDKVVTDWNLQAFNLTNTPSADAHGKLLDDVFPMIIPFMDMIDETLNTNTEQSKNNVVIETGTEKKYYDITTYPITLGNDNGAVLRIDDITTRQYLNKILMQSEKMVTIGGLAAGMAHEIKNPLGIIVQNSQNIINRLDVNAQANVESAQKIELDLTKMHTYLEDRKILKFIDNMRIAVDRALTIITNMLRFGKTSTAEMSRVNVKELIEESVDFVSKDYELKKTFDFKVNELVINYEDNLPDITCARTEVVQVFLNLLKNAAQAMDSTNMNPQISISAKRLDDKNIEIKIQDNGKGMSDYVKENIFKPFFTTKSMGIGTGLGLSVCQFIIQEMHHGKINVESQEAVGTTFIIQLPIEQEALPNT